MVSAIRSAAERVHPLVERELARHRPSDCGMHFVNATSDVFGNGIFDGQHHHGPRVREAVTDPDNFATWQVRLRRHREARTATSARGPERRKDHARFARIRRPAAVEQRGLRRHRQRLRGLLLRRSEDETWSRQNSLPDVAVWRSRSRRRVRREQRPFCDDHEPGERQRIAAHRDAYSRSRLGGVRLPGCLDDALRSPARRAERATTTCT